VARDSAIKKQITDSGKAYFSFNANLLFEPWEIKNLQGNPYGVFTPFWKTCLARGDIAPPTVAPDKINFASGVKSENLSDWQLLPTAPDWSGGMRAAWQPGEVGAKNRLQAFLSGGFAGYAGGRDRPDQNHVSRLSPHLHWGEISPRQIFYAADAALAAGHGTARDADKFKAEIGWREFSYSLLFHNPTLPTQPLQKRFENFPWQENAEYLRAWQRGQTGVPMVDAGMRELWHTGYMHNRVRMIVASFLVKNLLQPWQAGEQWFWDTLCDADLANNSASWQWVAGCGADAAPYFRIFNPFLQGAKFDPNGDYVRQWIPEISHVPNKFIHTPWLLPNPPREYPAPVVDFPMSRDRALKAFEVLKEQGS
jgi:deoxyribodipyrimidine photo-lyase